MAGQTFSKPVGEPFNQMSPAPTAPAPIQVVIPLVNDPIPVPRSPPRLHISLDAQPPEYLNSGSEGGRLWAEHYDAGMYDGVIIAPGPGEFFCRNREDFERQVAEGRIPGMGPNAPRYPDLNLPQVSPTPMPTFNPWAPKNDGRNGKKRTDKKKKGKKTATRRSSCHGMSLRSQRRQDKDDDEKDKYRVRHTRSSRIPVLHVA